MKYDFVEPSGVQWFIVCITVYHSSTDTVGREGNLVDAYKTDSYYIITYIEHQVQRSSTRKVETKARKPDSYNSTIEI